MEFLILDVFLLAGSCLAMIALGSRKGSRAKAGENLLAAALRMSFIASWTLGVVPKVGLFPMPAPIALVAWMLSFKDVVEFMFVPVIALALPMMVYLAAARAAGASGDSQRPRTNVDLIRGALDDRTRYEYEISQRNPLWEVTRVFVVVDGARFGPLTTPESAWVSQVEAHAAAVAAVRAFADSKSD